jgi:hypothetical protein
VSLLVASMGEAFLVPFQEVENPQHQVAVEEASYLVLRRRVLVLLQAPWAPNRVECQVLPLAHRALLPFLLPMTTFP